MANNICRYADKHCYIFSFMKLPAREGVLNGAYISDSVINGNNDQESVSSSLRFVVDNSKRSTL